jgi:hypothetical protein
LWLEIGSDLGHQKTDFWYISQEDFYKSTISAKGGYRFYAFDRNLSKKGNSKLNIHIDPYIKTELLADLGNREHNEFFWSNNLKYGAGFRARLEYNKENKKEHDLELNYINFDYFIEFLNMDSIGRGDEIPDNIPRDDFRTGFNSWLFVDNNLKLDSESCFTYGTWFNIWSDLTYARTLFFLKEKNNFIILTLSLKGGSRFGYKGIAFEPYYKVDYVRDLLSRDWNTEAWSNNMKYGFGLRLSLGGLLQLKDPERFKNCSIFLYSEYLNIDFHSRVKDKSEGLAEYDFRVGLNLWMPFGASKSSRAEAR